jgi:hypothetical protein
MKRFKVAAVLIIALSLMACSSMAQIKANWAAMKSDEKARVVCEFLQSELSTLFDSGKAYVATRPDLAAKWKGEVVPAFSVANKALGAYMIQAKKGEVTFTDVMKGMLPLLSPITKMLSAWGVDVSSITNIVGGL